MITLVKRPCYIGASINVRTELHGEEPVPAFDLPLTGLMIEAEELNSLLEEPHAHRLLFNVRSGGKLSEPVFRALKPLQLEHKFEGCRVTILFGANRKDLVIEDCTVAKVKLEPQAGGLTMLSCVVQTSGHAADLNRLVEKMKGEIDVEIEFGEAAQSDKDRQQDLPINRFEGDDAPAPDEEESGRKKRRGGRARPDVH